MFINQLSENEFTKFKEIIYLEAGIKLTDLKKALVQARLSRRMRALSLSTYEDYYSYLIENYTHEKENFINAITTNKTEFFREKKHFDFMLEVALPEFEKDNIKDIRIWSAGCSTGEEAYTIAITLCEYFKNKRKPDIKILATDIDTQVLERAQAGIYLPEQVATVQHDILQKYFTKRRNESQEYYKINDFAKDMVFFRHLNLHLEQYPMKRQFHIIFCRNVIIYFDKSMQAKLFTRFHRYLKDTGYLMIGHSENISNITTDFKLIGNTIYRKM